MPWPSVDHGADPNRSAKPRTALDYVIGTYVRDPQRPAACVDALLTAGARTRYHLPVLPSSAAITKNWPLFSMPIQP